MPIFNTSSTKLPLKLSMGELLQHATFSECNYLSNPYPDADLDKSCFKKSLAND